MRLRSPGLLLLFLLLVLLPPWGLRADKQEEEDVRAVLGSDVVLPCVYHQRASFDLSDLFVYWQISQDGRPEIVAYHLPGNSSSNAHSDRYRGRARLSPDSMKLGDFSLHLQNVTPQDEQTFQCLVFVESLELENILNVKVTLHVAANYSVPVVSGPTLGTQDELLTFTCQSTNSYLQPMVYWINWTDSTRLDAALQDHTIVRNARGLYDAVSVLRLPRSPRVDIGCCIENTLLRQRLISGTQSETATGDRLSTTPHPDGTPKGRPTTVTVTVAVLAVAMVVAVVVATYRFRGRCQPRSYAGGQAMRVEMAPRELV